MTVKELITELEKFDGNLLVGRYDEHGDFHELVFNPFLLGDNIEI